VRGDSGQEEVSEKGSERCGWVGGVGGGSDKAHAASEGRVTTTVATVRKGVFVFSLSPLMTKNIYME